MIGGTVFRGWFTGPGNLNFELGRALWALSLLWFLGLGIWAVAVNGQMFEPQDYGLGVGIVLAAGGVGIAAKDTAASKARQKEE